MTAKVWGAGTRRRGPNLRKKPKTPPNVGDIFEGPPIGHGALFPRTLKNGKYHVSAVLDAYADPKYGWLYHVVFAFYTRNKGWRYVVESNHAIDVGLYTLRRRKRPKPLGKADVGKDVWVRMTLESAFDPQEVEVSVVSAEDTIQLVLDRDLVKLA